MATAGSAMMLGRLAPQAHAGIDPDFAHHVAPTDHEDNVFLHSVASGDPLPNGVIIWTRVTPTTEAVPGSELGPDVPVRWEVSTDPEFSAITAAGTEKATIATDHTVKVDVTGLAPATTYFYRFHAEVPSAAGPDGHAPDVRTTTSTSPLGRTRTAPATHAELDSVRFGVCSCANYESGYFQVYREMAQRDDLEFVIHLGDYTYEYEQGGYPGLYQTSPRQVRPQHKTTTLQDYRVRQGLYHEDPDLAALHAAKPMICMWDDHEFADNNWREGATASSFDKDQDYAALKAAASRAYFEWMPVRVDPDAGAEHLYRRLQYGQLMDLIIPDLRTYRDAQLIRTGDHLLDTDPDFARAAGDPDRTMLGNTQLEWFRDAVTTSPAQWQIIANAVMFSPLTIPPGINPKLQDWLIDTVGLPGDGVGLNMDQWDGYMAERQEIIDLIGDTPDRNVVFLTGDIHSSWASDIPRDVRAYRNGQNFDSVATEFIAPAITANGPFSALARHEALHEPARAIIDEGENLLRAVDHWFKWIDLRFNGYMAVEVNKRGTQCDWHFVENVLTPDTPFWLEKSFSVQPGNPGPRPVAHGLDRGATVY